MWCNLQLLKPLWQLHMEKYMDRYEKDRYVESVSSTLAASRLKHGRLAVHGIRPGQDSGCSDHVSLLTGEDGGVKRPVQAEPKRGSKRCFYGQYAEADVNHAVSYFIDL